MARKTRGKRQGRFSRPRHATDWPDAFYNDEQTSLPFFGSFDFLAILFAFCALPS